MANSVSVDECVRILDDAWYDFTKYFDERCATYSKGMDKEVAKKSHWVCWTEFDLVAQLSRFYYKRLEERVYMVFPIISRAREVVTALNPKR